MLINNKSIIIMGWRTEASIEDKLVSSRILLELMQTMRVNMMMQAK